MSHRRHAVTGYLCSVVFVAVLLAASALDAARAAWGRFSQAVKGP